MEDKLCLVLIANKYQSLTTAEKKIADVICKMPKDVAFMSASALAKNAGVAPSAVIRFCNTLGFDGFSKMKISLAMELSRNKNESYSTEVNANDNSAVVLEKVFGGAKKALDDTLKMIDKIAMDRAIASMLYAGKILFFGIGTSSSVAMDAGYRIMQLGYPATYAVDPLYMRVSASDLKKGDVAFGISNSGMSKDVIDTMKIAKEKGATTVAVTSHKDSPLTEYADIVLCVYSDRFNYPVEAVSSRIVTVSLIDAIKISLSLQNNEKTQSSIKNMKNIVTEIRK